MNIEVDPTSSNLASAMLNSNIRPRAVVGYGVKIFHPSPPNYVTRSPGAEWEGQDSLFASRKLTVKNFKVRLASNILICWNELLHFEIKHPFHSGCDRERNGSVLR